jgi:succinate-acetate transporter protein
VPLLFFLLAAGDINGSATLKKIAGYEGIVCGLSAIYTGLPQVLNEVHGKILVALGPVK